MRTLYVLPALFLIGCSSVQKSDDTLAPLLPPLTTTTISINEEETEYDMTRDQFHPGVRSQLEWDFLGSFGGADEFVLHTGYELPVLLDMGWTFCENSWAGATATETYEMISAMATDPTDEAVRKSVYVAALDTLCPDQEYRINP